MSVNAGSELVLSGPGSQITALSTANGDVGLVTVAASRLMMNDGAAISTEGTPSFAGGGNIFMFPISSIGSAARSRPQGDRQWRQHRHRRRNICEVCRQHVLGRRADRDKRNPSAERYAGRVVD
jgi:hypothetical protein